MLLSNISTDGANTVSEKFRSTPQLASTSTSIVAASKAAFSAMCNKAIKCISHLRQNSTTQRKHSKNK